MDRQKLQLLWCFTVQAEKHELNISSPPDMSQFHFPSFSCHLHNNNTFCQLVCQGAGNNKTIIVEADIYCTPQIVIDILFFLSFLFFKKLINLFIFGCVWSSFLCEGFLQLWRAGATLHRGARASHCRGLSLWSTGSRRAGSVVGSRAQLLRGMWDLPRPGLEPVFPALAGRLSTIAPPGKPDILFNMYHHLRNLMKQFIAFIYFVVNLDKLVITAVT